MRKFLCLENLVMKEIGRVELTAGRLYRETKPIGDRDNAVINNSGKTHNNVQRWGVFVETFERDGVEWIKHDGGGCPVPGGWKVEFSHEFGGHVFGRGGLLARLFCWGPIVAYRIISTGEPEESGAGGGIELGDKDESEINDTKENLSLMDTLTQNQRDYITRKELEQAEKQQAQEQEKADEIEHKQQQSNDLVRANGVFNDR